MYSNDDDVIIVEDANDVTDLETATGNQGSHVTESVHSSEPVLTSNASHLSNLGCSNQMQSVSHVSCPGPSSVSCSREHSQDAMTDLSHDEQRAVPESKIAKLDHLLTLFQGKLNKKQISALYDFTCHDFDKTMECLLLGPDLNSILKLMSKVSKTCPVVKIHVDEDDIMSDLVYFYKVSDTDISRCRIRIRLNGQPAIDTGGVRRQIYTSVLQQFSENLPFKLFDGPSNSLRPHYSAATRCSGMFKVLGTIVGHSIFQDGIGFPYLSPACYWYIAAGEEEAQQYLTLDDVGADCCSFVNQVSTTFYNSSISTSIITVK